MVFQFQRLTKWDRNLNVDREVLFIEISLKYYPEDIFSSCKNWKLENPWLKKLSVAQCKNLLDWKLPGLINYEQLLRAVFFIFWGGKKNLTKHKNKCPQNFADTSINSTSLSTFSVQHTFCSWTFYWTAKYLPLLVHIVMEWPLIVLTQ